VVDTTPDHQAVAAPRPGPPHSHDHDLGWSGTGALPCHAWLVSSTRPSNLRAGSPHTAYRRSSPAAFRPCPPVPEGSRRDDGSVQGQDR
jgi:hypothetical protein